MVSVRWRPLLSAHSRKQRISDKSLTQTSDVLRSSKWRLSSWTFYFCDRRCFSAVSHPQQYSNATRDTVVLMNTEQPTKYALSHNDRIIVLEMRLHSEIPILYRPALHGNWSALSLARRSHKDKFPAPTVPPTDVLPYLQIFMPEPVELAACVRDLVEKPRVEVAAVRTTVLAAKRRAEVASRVRIHVHKTTVD